MKIILPFFLIFSFYLQAQQDSWEHYYKGDFTNDILETTTDIWMATNVGLVKIDKTTEQRELYNVFNSDLNNHYIRSIIEDHDGIIWIKTNVGISNFDGATWTHFTPDNSILEHDDTKDDYYFQNDQLFVDVDNKLWTKNNNRLIYYTNNTWTVTYETDNLILFQVNPNGSAWLRYRNGGGQSEYLRRFDGTNWVVEDGNLPVGISPYFTHMISFDSQGNFWFTVNSSINNPESGLLKWSPISQDYTFFLQDTSITFDAGGVTIDKNDHVWSYSSNGSFVKFSEPNIWEVIPVTDTINNQFVKNAVPTDDGIAFTIVKFAGNRLSYIGFVNDQNQVELIETLPYLYERNDNMKYLSDGSLFIGNIQDRALLFSGNQFQSIEFGNAQLPSDQVYSILGEDNIGKKYFNSDSPDIGPGLFYVKKFSSFDGQDWNTIDYPDTITGQARVNQNGEILMADQSGTSLGIHVFKNNIWEELDTQSELFFNQEIEDFEIDQDDNLWLTAKETPALFKYKNDIWTTYNYADYGIGSSFQIYGFDAQNQIWIDHFVGMKTFWLSNITDSFELAFDDVSLLFPLFGFPSYAPIKMVGQQNGNKFFMKSNRFFKYDGTDFEVFDTTNSIIPFGTEFYNIKKDSSDNIWLATNQGVFKFDGNSEWKNFTPYNSPLADIIIEDIFIDAEQNIWMANYHSGIYVLTEDQSTNTTTIIPTSQILASIYPNPFASNITIFLNLENQEMVQLEIIDLTGRVIQDVFKGKKLEGNHQVKVDLPHLTQGIYFCRIVVGNKSRVLKFVKL